MKKILLMILVLYSFGFAINGYSNKNYSNQVNNSQIAYNKVNKSFSSEEKKYKFVGYLIALGYRYIPLLKENNSVDSIDIKKGTTGIFVNDLNNNDILYGKGYSFTTEASTLPLLINSNGNFYENRYSDRYVNKKMSMFSNNYIKNNFNKEILKYDTISHNFLPNQNTENHFVRTVNTYGIVVDVKGYRKLLQILNHIWNFDFSNKGFKGIINGKYLRDVYKSAKENENSRKLFKKITGVDINDLPKFEYQIDLFSYKNNDIPYGGLEQKVWYTPTENGIIGICKSFDSLGRCITDVKPDIDTINGSITIPYFVSGKSNVYQENNGYINIDNSTKTFCVENDDGFRLWINGRKVIDKWYNQSANWTCHTISGLKVGLNAFSIQFYDRGGERVLRLEMNQNGRMKEIDKSLMHPASIPECGDNMFLLTKNSKGSFCILNKRLNEKKIMELNLRSLQPYDNNVKFIKVGFYNNKQYTSLNKNKKTNKTDVLNASVVINTTGKNENIINFENKNNNQVFSVLYETKNNPNYDKCVLGQRFEDTGKDLNKQISIYTENTFDKMFNDYLEDVYKKVGVNFITVLNNFTNKDELEQNLKKQLKDTKNSVSTLNFYTNTSNIDKSLTPYEYINNIVKTDNYISDNNVSIGLNDFFNPFVEILPVKSISVYDLTKNEKCVDNNETNLKNYFKTTYYLNSDVNINLKDITHLKTYVMNYKKQTDCNNTNEETGIKSLKEIANDLFSNNKNYEFDNGRWNLFDTKKTTNKAVIIQFKDLSNIRNGTINKTIKFDTRKEFNNHFNTMMLNNDAICSNFINFNIKKDKELRQILAIFKNFFNDVKKTKIPYTMNNTSLGNYIYNLGLRSSSQRKTLNDQKHISGFKIKWKDPGKHCGAVDYSKFPIGGNYLKNGLIQFLNNIQTKIDSINKSMDIDTLINFANKWSYLNFKTSLLIAKMYKDNNLKEKLVESFKNNHNYKLLLNDYNIQIRGKNFGFKGLNNINFNRTTGVVPGTCSGQSFLGWFYRDYFVLKTIWNIYDESINDFIKERNKFLENITSEIDMSAFNTCLNELQANKTTKIDLKNFNLNSLVNNSNYKYLRSLKNGKYVDNIVNSNTKFQTVIGNLYKDIYKYKFGFKTLSKDGIEICDNLLNSVIKVKQTKEYPSGFDNIFGFYKGNFTYDKFYPGQSHRSLFQQPNIFQSESCANSFRYDKQGNTKCDKIVSFNNDLNRKDVAIIYKPLDKNKKYWFSVEMLDLNSFIKNKDTGSTKNEYGSLLFTSDIIKKGNYDNMTYEDKLTKDCVNFKSKYKLETTNNFFSGKPELRRNYYNSDKLFTYKDKDGGYQSVLNCDDIKAKAIEKKYDGNIDCSIQTQKTKKLASQTDYYTNNNISYNDSKNNADIGNIKEQIKQANNIGGEKVIKDGVVKVKLTNEIKDKQKGLNITNSDKFLGDMSKLNSADVGSEYKKLGLNVNSNTNANFQGNNLNMSNINKTNKNYSNKINDLKNGMSNKDKQRLASGGNTFLGKTIDKSSINNNTNLNDKLKVKDLPNNLLTLQNCVDCNKPAFELRSEAENKLSKNKDVLTEIKKFKNIDPKLVDEKVNTDIHSDYKMKSIDSEQKKNNILNKTNDYINNFNKTNKEQKNTVKGMFKINN